MIPKLCSSEDRSLGVAFKLRSLLETLSMSDTDLSKRVMFSRLREFLWNHSTELCLSVIDLTSSSG